MTGISVGAQLWALRRTVTGLAAFAVSVSAVSPAADDPPTSPADHLILSGRIGLGGEVWLDTAAGVRKRPEARNVGYVPQDGLLFPHLPVTANLAFGLRRAAARDGPALGDVVEVLVNDVPFATVPIMHEGTMLSIPLTLSI